MKLSSEDSVDPPDDANLPAHFRRPRLSRSVPPSCWPRRPPWRPALRRRFAARLSGDRALRRCRDEAGGPGVARLHSPVPVVERRRPQEPVDRSPAGDEHRRRRPRRLGLPGRHPAVEGVRLRAPGGDALHRAHRRRLGLRHLSLARGRERRLLAPKFGQRAVYELADGVRYDLPARTDCRACHEGNVSRVLGFSALQLSAARDPGAPHAEPLRPGDVDLAMLVAQGKVKGLPADLRGLARRRSRHARPRSARRWAISTATARAATTRAARSPTSTSRSKCGSRQRVPAPARRRSPPASIGWPASSPRARRRWRVSRPGARRQASSLRAHGATRSDLADASARNRKSSTARRWRWSRRWIRDRTSISRTTSKPLRTGEKP